MPKVSVIIPCFNSAEFIKETLDSVLGQGLGDIEVIVMDDGSKDDTGRIVKSFIDKRIRYFYKDNEGLSETRNKAMKLAEGHYMAFIDHDDIWMKGKLEKQISFLDRRGDVGVVYADSFIDVDGKRAKKTRFSYFPPHRGLIFERLLFEPANFIPALTVVARRSIFDEIGFFNPQFKIAEELDIFIRIAEKHRFDYIDEPLAIYRIHDNNTSRDSELLAKEYFEIMDFWKKKEPDIFRRNNADFHKAQAHMLEGLGSFYALNFKREKAIDSFNRSMSNHRNNRVLFKKHIAKFLGCRAYRLLSRTTNAIGI